MPDNDTTTEILLHTRAQRLEVLDRELQNALATQRSSKPLATQHAQLEAFLRRLCKSHDATASELCTAQADLEKAQIKVDSKLAALAESQARIDEAKKNAADIASRMAAELGGTPTKVFSVLFGKQGHAHYLHVLLITM